MGTYISIDLLAVGDRITIGEQPEASKLALLRCVRSMPVSGSGQSVGDGRADACCRRQYRPNVR